MSGERLSPLTCPCIKRFIWGEGEPLALLSMPVRLLRRQRAQPCGPPFGRALLSMSVRLLRRLTDTACGRPLGRCQRWRCSPSPQAPPSLPQCAFTGEESGTRGTPAPRSKRSMFSLFILSIAIICKICVNRPWSSLSLKKANCEASAQRRPAETKQKNSIFMPPEGVTDARSLAGPRRHALTQAKVLGREWGSARGRGKPFFKTVSLAPSHYLPA